jgi:hypothetical protein
MARDHVLMYVLSGIILLNIIAIVLLNNRLVVETPPVQEMQPPPLIQPIIITQRETVRTLLIEPACADCFDIREYLVALNDTISMQVEVVPQTDLLLFASNRLPALAFNASLASYPSMIEGWEEIGYITNISEGNYAGAWYILPTQNAPYYSPLDDRVHGRVSVTYITMKTCSECYDVYTLRASLNASRITPYAEQTLDARSAQGKALIEKYNITAVPTLLMDGEAAEYRNLQPGWNIVGTVEEDGTHVLRDLQRLQVVYYDLEHAKLMKP